MAGSFEYIPSDGAAEEVNQALTTPEECKTPSEVWRIAMEQGMVISPELEIATKEFKTALQDEYMLNGKTKVIHDENIMIKYADILGKIGESIQNHISQGTPVIVDTKVQEIVDNYISNLDATTLGKDLLLEYIRLHFHCFKGCFDTNCLSTD